ncbi:methylmalonyl-CoA mutase subunit beta [Polaribacter sp. R77954]|uniref:methylmalonyl-CoA mutase subunit beta n=1 Tax=Polaribacter sp. R77954 TaxID=3093870 RepID=UPI0037C69D24
MSEFLFDEFDAVSPAAWKQKIQVDLKGADYNKTLLWKTDEGITVKPFYTKEDRKNTSIQLPKKGFNICQSIFIGDEKIANSLALNALQRGANSIRFKATTPFNPKKLLKGFAGKTLLYFQLTFLDVEFQTKLSEFCDSNNTFIETDIIGNLAETGNWFYNLKKDHLAVEEIVPSSNHCISVSGDLYQNAGANLTQQLAYTLAHANEYLNSFGAEIANKIHFKFAVGSNYFFEIAKLRAFRILWASLLKEYNVKNVPAHIFTQPSLRNKTLYDYNTNMLRTTSECMSAILGGSDTISNVAYDHIYHKSNEFGERIARNQLLILQQESYFQEAHHFADGAYYIDALTHQLAHNALTTFKQVEKSGGFLKQLKNGSIQKKINESATREQERFDTKEIVLLGTNLQSNAADKMKQNLELYPFVKQRHIKTIITPIVRKRISETIEKQRLDNE